MGLLLKVNTSRPSIRASEVTINFSRQAKTQVVPRWRSKQIKCTLSATPYLFFMQHKEAEIAQPHESFQLSVVTWGSLTRFSCECQEIVFVTLPATSMEANLWAQIEMWPNRGAAGEVSWLKRRHIQSDRDWCWQERKRRSVVSYTLLKISPVQLWMLAWTQQ